MMDNSVLLKEPDMILCRGILQTLQDIDFILVLPSTDAAFNARVSAAFEKKLEDRRGMRVEGEQAQALLKLYSLYAFTDKLVIGSMDMPHGRKLRNLLDSGIATEETLINDVILEVMG